MRIISRTVTSISLLCGLAVCMCFNTGLAADSKELLKAFEGIHDPQFDTSSVFAVSGVTLKQKDITLYLDSGIFVRHVPVVIDGNAIVAGGFFFGHGRVLFRPSLGIERDQLRRFFESDSLDRRFWDAELFFSPKAGNEFYAQLTPIDSVLSKESIARMTEIHGHLVRFENRSLSFKTLRNLIEPSAQGYLLANLELEEGGLAVYRFDPTEREEVELYKRKWEMANDHIELVCKYAMTADDTYQNLNGFSKARLQSRLYKADLRVEKSSRVNARVDFTFDVLMSRTQIFDLQLEPLFEVDSILDSSGAGVSFLRWENKWRKEWELYVFLDRSLKSDETVTLTFYYGGKLNVYQDVEFFVSAHADFCPTYGFRQLAEYELTIHSPREFAISCSAVKLGETVEGPDLVSQWRVDTPTRQIAFDIGPVKRFQFSQADLPRVDLYFSEDLHRQLTESFERVAGNIKEQIADDVANATKLFNHYFGNYPYDKIDVTETMESGGVAYPGYLKLGLLTWVNTDVWGWDRLLRSHEVAHQWWGVGVSWATYRDQWLSEGFAEYSAFLYLQAVAGNDVFLDRFRECRDSIINVRKFLLHKEAEAGPIALGYRTSSSKAEGDIDLIIYKKGAFVLHMLRNLLIDFQTFNEDRFFNLMKEWYQTYNGQTATTADFQRMVEKHVGEDMTWFFNQWVYGNDIPVYTFDYKVDRNENGEYVAACHVKTEEVSDGFRMYVPLEIEYDEQNRSYARVLIDQNDFEFSLPPMNREPKKIRLNPFLSVLADVKQ